jgi:3-isopropylmalate/(R)-2-methylmalate dehydratase large subunit
MTQPRTLFEKIWDRHVVHQEAGFPTTLYVDLHLVHEVTSPQAFSGLREKGLPVRRPDRTLATMDHSTPTQDLSAYLSDDMAARRLSLAIDRDQHAACAPYRWPDASGAAKQLRQMEANCREYQIKLLDLQDPQRGIVHVVAPELGLTQPGMTIVCGDSHTSTHGAFGALAFGIGTSEVEHVLATQCLLQYRPKTFQVSFTGRSPVGVAAKDMVLALIAEIGIGGGSGHVIEYCGEAVKALNMEARMTLCNMSIEAGARAGMIAPDDTTFEYLAWRPYAPKNAAWEANLSYWQTLPSDPQASFDKSISLDVSKLEPMITYGTNPGMAIPISQPVPDPDREPDLTKRRALEKALRYMNLPAGQVLQGHPVDVVFIGSCTNGRLSDLRQAASLLADRKVAPQVRLVVVPGSESVRRQAEAEGLDRIFKDAGGEWRHSGCSMCIAMNGDQLQPGQYAVSTSNRNFEGRQGKDGRTFLASPLTAAASAIRGCITDPRRL